MERSRLPFTKTGEVPVLLLADTQNICIVLRTQSGFEDQEFR